MGPRSLGSKRRRDVQSEWFKISISGGKGGGAGLRGCWL